MHLSSPCSHTHTRRKGEIVLVRLLLILWRKLSGRPSNASNLESALFCSFSIFFHSLITNVQIHLSHCISKLASGYRPAVMSWLPFLVTLMSLSDGRRFTFILDHWQKLLFVDQELLLHISHFSCFPQSKSSIDFFYMSQSECCSHRVHFINKCW